MLRAELYVNNEKIGELNIRNDGTGMPNWGNYTFYMHEDGLYTKRWRGMIKDHNRSHSAWVLIAKALMQKFKKELK